MNVSLQNIRELGFKKISTGYIGTAKKRNIFFNNVKEVNALLSSYKMPPYSILGYWDSIKELDSVDVGGLKALILNVEPLISSQAPERTVKSKFRNTWNLLWEKYGEIAKLTNSELCMLSDLGLKLPLALAAYELEDERAIKLVGDLFLKPHIPMIHSLCEFFNALIKWYVMLQSEGNITVRDKTLYDVLTLLVTLNNDEFIEVLEEGNNLWD